MSIAQQAKLVVVAPATANVLARAAAGMADDLLTSTLLMARCPVVFAPAMHTEMWEHPATVANVETLRARGAIVVLPDSGRLTGSDTGPGRLPHPHSLAAVCESVLAQQASRTQVAAEADGSRHHVNHGSADLVDLAGLRVLVTAGGTREPLDPVRFLGNRSSGKQGWALAVSAAARGATVDVIAANVQLPEPAGCRVHQVRTAEELSEAVFERLPEIDVLVMAAAVADFRPDQIATTKIKKTADQDAPTISLARTQDILATVGQRNASDPESTLFLVGFAAETVSSEDELVELGRLKLRTKNADMVVANGVGLSQGFESDVNAATIVTRDGDVIPVPLASKLVVANTVWDAVAQRLPRAGG